MSRGIFQGFHPFRLKEYAVVVDHQGILVQYVKEPPDGALFRVLLKIHEAAPQLPALDAQALKGRADDGPGDIERFLPPNDRFSRWR